MNTRNRSGSNSSTSSPVAWGAQDGEQGSHRYPKLAKIHSGKETQPQSDEFGMTSTSEQERVDLPEPIPQKPPKGDPKRVRAPPPVQASGSDSYIQTHSYVQTHRMHQQQRSIAGYEDELALRGANELTATQRAVELERQRMPPTPNDSIESLPDEEKGLCEKQGDSPGSHDEEKEAQEHLSSLSGRPPPVAMGDQQQQASSPRHEKVPGLHRRPKVVSPSTSTTSTRTVTQTSNAPGSPFRPVSPPSPVSQESIRLVSKKFKAEKLVESTVAKPPTPPPKAANRTSPRSNPRLGIETGSYASRHRKTMSTTGSSSTISSHDLTSAPSTPKGLTKSAKVPAPSHQMEEQVPLPSGQTAGDDNKQNTSEGNTWTSTKLSGFSIVPPEVRVSKPVPEVVVEGIDGDGMVRRASVKRPRSTPQLQDIVVSQDLSFLPELKHQALVKPDRKSPTSSLASSRSSLGGLSSLDRTTAHSPPQFPAPSPPSTRPSSDDGNSLPLGASSLNYMPKAGARSSTNSIPGSLLRPGSGVRRSTMSNGSPASGAAAAQQLKPLAKLFVICCNCNYWHDLPSELYKEMAMPRQILGEDRVAESVGAGRGNEPQHGNENDDGIGRGDERRTSRLEGKVETSHQGRSATMQENWWEICGRV